MCGGRLKGGVGSSESISTSSSLVDAGERGAGPASGSWISMSELRRIIIRAKDAKLTKGEEEESRRGSTDKILEAIGVVHGVSLVN